MYPASRSLAIASSISPASRQLALGPVDVEPHAEAFQGRLDPRQDPFGAQIPQACEPDVLRQVRDGGPLLLQDVASDVRDVVAPVAVLGQAHVPAQLLEEPRLDGPPEPVHLPAGVVEVVLALDTPPLVVEQRRQGVPDRRVACVADRQRTGRVRTDELHLDAPAVRLGGAVGRAARHDIAERVVEPTVGDEDVQEPRPGHLHALDERRLGEGRADRLGDLPRFPPGARRQDERDVGREVAVLLLFGGQQLRFGPFAVDPESVRGGVERCPDQLEEALLDHVPCRSATRRRTSSTRSPGSKGLLTKSTGPSPSCEPRSSSGARAVRNTTGTSARFGMSRICRHTS